MHRTFAELFQAQAYPAMSHPSADPAVNREVARAVGLDVAALDGSRVLEIGCGTGHHLLSVANAWPTAKCIGVDLSTKAIARAKNLAQQAGLRNVEFHEGSILEFDAAGEFDFIIAHGVFSWVPDEVKLGLMDFIGKRLTKNGIATVSFNVAAGWKERIRVVEKTRAIQAAGGVDEMTALAVYKTVADDAEVAILDDMLAKGAEVLAFDDFAPLMDAWSLGAIVKLAEQYGLSWLGDSKTGDKGDDTNDAEVRKTFRSELFCRKGAVFGAPSTRANEVKIELRVPDFPKLDAWRLVCAREALPVVDDRLQPCVFPLSQLKVLAAMDGRLSVVALAEHAKEFAPELDFIPWLRYVSERGFLCES